MLEYIVTWFHKIRAPFNEFVWMWLASVSPLLFGGLFVIIFNDDFSYLDVLLLSIEPDAIFAYVATMIAPYLFFIHKFIKNKKATSDEIAFSGTFIILSIVIAIITAGIFSFEKVEKFSLLQNVESEVSSVMPIRSMLAVYEVGATKAEVKIDVDIKAKILLFCYAFSLFTWFYTIYLGHKQPPDLQKESNKKINKMMAVADDMFDGNDK